MKTLALICAALAISTLPAEAAKKRHSGSSCPRVESKGDVAWTESGAREKAVTAWRGDVIAQFGSEAAENMVNPVSGAQRQARSSGSAKRAVSSRLRANLHNFG